MAAAGPDVVAYGATLVGVLQVPSGVLVDVIQVTPTARTAIPTGTTLLQAHAISGAQARIPAADPTTPPHDLLRRMTATAA